MRQSCPMPPHKRHLSEAFGEVIREWHIRKALTQEQLSFRAKLHRTYIGDLERGRKSPTLDVIDGNSKWLQRRTSSSSFTYPT